MTPRCQLTACVIGSVGQQVDERSRSATVNATPGTIAD